MKKPSSAGSQTRTPRRLPYEKPQVMSETTFETLALACSKVEGQFPPCNVTQLSS